MGDPVTGYVIYYQPEGGDICSATWFREQTETLLLDCLQEGVAYNISIVALSLHLPSLLVGPVTVITSMSITLVICLYI